jgi:hypothetical protein
MENIMQDSEEEFDVVTDVLQKHWNLLNKMVQQNMNAEMFNIMDQIRLEQMDQLKKAMKMWRER